MMKAFEDLREIGASDGRPANNSANNGKFLREVQQGFGLRKRLSCLNRDASLDSGSCKHLLEILRQKISGDGRHIAGDPAVVFFRIAPEVVVGVNSISHGFWTFARVNLRKRLKR